MTMSVNWLARREGRIYSLWTTLRSKTLSSVSNSISPRHDIIEIFPARGPIARISKDRKHGKRVESDENTATVGLESSQERIEDASWLVPDGGTAALSTRLLPEPSMKLYRSLDSVEHRSSGAQGSRLDPRHRHPPTLSLSLNLSRFDRRDFQRCCDADRSSTSRRTWKNAFGISTDSPDARIRESRLM